MRWPKAGLAAVVAAAVVAVLPVPVGAEVTVSIEHLAAPPDLVLPAGNHLVNAQGDLAVESNVAGGRQHVWTAEGDLLDRFEVPNPGDTLNSGVLQFTSTRLALVGGPFSGATLDLVTGERVVLEAPAGRVTSPSPFPGAIRDDGTVVGHTNDASNTVSDDEPALWHPDGTRVDLPGPQARAVGIDAAGRIAGNRLSDWAVLVWPDASSDPVAVPGAAGEVVAVTASGYALVERLGTSGQRQVVDLDTLAVTTVWQGVDFTLHRARMSEAGLVAFPLSEDGPGVGLVDLATQARIEVAHPLGDPWRIGGVLAVWEDGTVVVLATDYATDRTLLLDPDLVWHDLTSGPLGGLAAYASDDGWLAGTDFSTGEPWRARVTAVPDAPLALAAATSGRTVTLSWWQPDGPAVTGYRVARDGVDIATVAATSVAMTYVDEVPPGLGPTVAYTVVAVGPDGESVVAEISVTLDEPPPAAPPPRPVGAAPRFTG